MIGAYRAASGAASPPPTTHAAPARGQPRGSAVAPSSGRAVPAPGFTPPTGSLASSPIGRSAGSTVTDGAAGPGPMDALDCAPAAAGTDTTSPPGRVRPGTTGSQRRR